MSGELRLQLRAVRGREGGRIALTVELSCGDNREERELILDAARYCELKPQKGTLTEEQLEALERGARISEAVRRGESLLAFGANTERGLAVKLRQRGFSAEEAEEAAAELKARGLINEEGDLRRAIERCLSKHWGEERIRGYLREKGFSREALEEAEALLAEVDFGSLCRELILKKTAHVPAERAARDRLTASIMRYGYRFSQVREAFLQLEWEDGANSDRLCEDED